MDENKEPCLQNARFFSISDLKQISHNMRCICEVNEHIIRLRILCAQSAIYFQIQPQNIHIICAHKSHSHNIRIIFNITDNQRIIIPTCILCA
jgi:hypothetical protein